MIEILILIILWLLTNAISCGVGYYFAAKSKKKKAKTRENPQAIDSVQALKAARSAAELRNLYSYNGDEQTEINADVR